MGLVSDLHAAREALYNERAKVYYSTLSGLATNLQAAALRDRAGSI